MFFLSPLWAIIIGIDDYKDGTIQNKGAVSDAEAMCRFLEDTLELSDQQICMLTDQAATYAGIMKAIKEHFITNADVRHGDPLLFYFAGHGSRYARPLDDSDFWDAICPSDRDTKAPSGATVCDITDRDLRQMFAELEAQKGNNILVIKDCCHTGGDDQEHANLRVRYAPPIQDQEAMRKMSVDAFSHEVGESSSRGTEPTSYVLLSACQQDEQAYELPVVHEDGERWSGMFTAALLSQLNKDHLPQLTYDSLVARMLVNAQGQECTSLMQHPQCEGENKQRAIFNGRPLGFNRRLVQINFTLDGQLEVHAGEIHGVVPGTEFSVWPNQDATIEPPCGKLIAKKVLLEYSFVEPANPEFAPQSGWFASISWWTNPGHSRFPFDVAFQEETKKDECQRMLAEHMQLVYSSQSHDRMEEEEQEDEGRVSLLISAHDGVMKVERNHPLTDTIVVEKPCPIPEDGPTLLNRILGFELNLARTNPAHPLIENVEFRIVRKGEPERVDLFDELHQALLPNDDAEYEFIIKNKGTRLLWVYLFYFDPETYTVTRLHGGVLELRARVDGGHELIIKKPYADDDAFSFKIKEGRSQHLGFAKLFVSTQYTSLAMFEEQDEFIYVPTLVAREAPPMPQPGEPREPLWDSIVATITVK